MGSFPSPLKQKTMNRESSKYSISEERDELMVSPTGGSPFYRVARFLKPTAITIEGQRPTLPSLPFSSEAEWPLEVTFSGWRAPQNVWKDWVADMRAKHLPVWISAGIDEAIMCSIYKINRNDELVVGLAERWCSETNTFVFAWGEATITLEDIMVLGGFSVLGEPVKFTLEEPDLKEIEQSLERSRNDMERLKIDNHTKWLKLFMGGGSRVEHEAFISLWLSRFVFSGNVDDKIDKHVFPVAVRLARGIRTALAPAVLASIYRDLGSLREIMEMVASDLRNVEENGNKIEFYALTLRAPLHLVQIWAWERIISLRPSPNCINPGDLRLARWHNLNTHWGMNVRECIDSSGEAFLWRPYVLAIDNWGIPKFYKENEQSVDDDDEDLKSFMHCLRVCELVGVVSIEPYRPNRVAMQFGFDQDIPLWVPRPSNISAEVAWYEYIRPIEVVNIQPRLLESDVTMRYLEWWRRSVALLPFGANQGLLHRRRSSRPAKGSLKNITQTSNNKAFIEKEENRLDVPPSFSPKSNLADGNEHTSMMHNANEGCKMLKRNQENLVDAPPGFPPRPTLADASPSFPPRRTLADASPRPTLTADDDNHNELEVRIARLEKLVAWFKKHR